MVLWDHHAGTGTWACSLFEVSPNQSPPHDDSKRSAPIRSRKGATPIFEGFVNHITSDLPLLQAMRELVAQCLQKDPAKRPSASALLESKFFKVRLHQISKNVSLIVEHTGYQVLGVPSAGKSA